VHVKSWRFMAKIAIEDVLVDGDEVATRCGCLAVASGRSSSLLLGDVYVAEGDCIVSLPIERGVVEAEPVGDEHSQQGQAEDVVGTADARIAEINHSHHYHT
jgi:hypothetical protein